MKNDSANLKKELPLASDQEVIDLVIQFENCTLPIQNWTHRAHLAVGIFYLRALNQQSALARLRERIQRFNQCCGDPSGYNETVTQMFVRKLASERDKGNWSTSMHEEVARLTHLCSVDWLYVYYSKQRVWSAQAKANWIDPDIRDLDF